MTMSAVDLGAFRLRVDEIVIALEVADYAPGDQRFSRLAFGDDVIRSVLAAHPQGLEGAVEALESHIGRFVPNSRSAASDVPGLVRVVLLHQIEVLWWGHLPAYATSAEVRQSPALVDLDPLRAAGKLRFRYRSQPRSLAQRATRAADRRLRPTAAPHSAGLRYTRAAPAMVALLNQIGDRFDERCGATHREAARAGIWLNSAVRSLAHQEHLRALGYSALEPSTHCSGLAVDIAVEWLRPTGGDRILKDVLNDSLEAGEINCIDEGDVWHVCPSPANLPVLRQAYDQQIGL